MGTDHEIDDDGRFTRFAVVQEAPEAYPTLRPHRLAVGVYDWDGDALVRTRRVELDVDGEHTEVPELVGADAGAMVLVNDDDLTFTKVRLDPRTMDVLGSSLGALDEPLPRALAWSAAWEMVRDAELPASRFVDMVVANVASETEVGVVQRLARRSLAAAERHAHPGHRDQLRTRLAADALDHLQKATPGSDHQVAWARQFASAANTDEHLGQVQALLDGAWEVPGLEVDTELRWHLVTTLAREGAVGADRVDQEHERDQTDMGQRHRLTARAAMPSPDEKAAAWRRLVEDTELSHTLSRAIWTGFQQLSQPELVAAYVQPYLGVLDQVWATRSMDWAIEFATAMFPQAAASHDLRRRVEDVLAREDLPGPLRRVLLEEHDVLVRTLAARARDAD